ncbi:MAG: lactate utilization protein [Atopobiaceae bacterium]|nr:lactate utilization protein [Atopobiaceae bacterium]MCI2173092.1 lactate utilization protein [Atopobiaceae bacterium]MCI2208185.1 lactate utilization protein [Atopobiaceae bacterium]
MGEMRLLDKVRTGDEDVDEVLEALWANRIGAAFVSRASDAVEKVRDLLVPGESVSCGGSHSLSDCGVDALLGCGDYDFIDRSQATSPEERSDLMRRALLCDTFLGSANALTRSGDILNVDMQANRVAAMLYGPRQVVLVVGMNKVVPTLDDAVVRLKRVAAPVNMASLGKGAPCESTGECVSVDHGGDCMSGLTKGCASPGRICCNYVVLSRQAPNNDQRIKVILVGESLGF